jgi:hypothetical protein
MAAAGRFGQKQVLMLQITPDDIAALKDDDLRTLVGLLCEAEVRRRGFSASAVTWGGNQDAPDGGIDVRVSLPKGAAIDGFVPKPETGYQVKKPDMPVAEITKEMRPKGKLRPAIQELAEKGGAYVIVSSGSSVSDSAWKERLAAMAAAVKDPQDVDALTLDYFDRGRLATWLRSHPGWIPWVRDRIGRRIKGWQSYGVWANPAEGVNAVYLVDDQIRIQTSEDRDGFTVVAGIERIRDTLHDPRKVVRLVGLSGVGKTRFVQALFDERLGKGSLDPSLAFYANLADDPDPQPIGLVSDLIASCMCAIIVVDNCPPDLHRRLSEVCRQPESLVSLVTVEYDIREDEPEETEVFRIEPSSVDLIEKLIRERFKQVSAVDARTIAEFSGGNARVAIALAHTVRKSETLAGLKDEDLFRRLFQQRHDHDDDLLLIAQACSLVYSFQADGTREQGSELPVFANLAGKTVQEIHRGVAELKRRDLVQKRSVWRAVLPHAIANRLAKLALQNIPRADIEGQLVGGNSERLLKSFSRRLGYLHDSDQAVQIVEGWFADGGLLGDLTRLNNLDRAILSNVAPVAPGAFLEAVARCSYKQIADRDDIIRVVRSIAYEAARFDQCVDLLASFAESHGPENDRSLAASSLVSLFTIVLSGTRAPLEQRLRTVVCFLSSEGSVRQKLGLHALEALLQTHVRPSHSFEFGARSRDYGYEPRGDEDLGHWYGSVLRLLEKLLAEPLANVSQLGSVLAGNFRGLWRLGVIADDLERVCNLIASRGFWREGWLAVRQTWKFDRHGMREDLRARLETLEKALRAVGLAERVRAAVLGGSSAGFDLDDFALDDVEKALKQRDATAFELGIETAQNQQVFGELLPEFVSNQGNLWPFGRGLGEGSKDPRVTWKDLGTALAATPASHRKTLALEGFLNGLHGKAPEVVDEILDESLTDECLGQKFPRLQAAVPIDKRGVERLKQCLTLGLAQITEYEALSGGRATDTISGEDLQALLSRIASKPDGALVALDILHMRLWSDAQQKKAVSSELIQAGCDVLKRIEFKKNAQTLDHRLAQVVKLCLGSEAGNEAFQAACENFKAAVTNYEVHTFEYDDFLQALFEVRPFEALDAFVGGKGRLGTILLGTLGHDKNPLDVISDDVLIEWCGRDPARRYPLVARIIAQFESDDKGSPVVWNSRVLKLLDHAADPVPVLKELVASLRPSSWQGSRASAMASRLPMIEELQRHPNPAVAEFARQDSARLREEIEEERRHETERDKASDERFE